MDPDHHMDDHAIEGMQQNLAIEIDDENSEMDPESGQLSSEEEEEGERAQDDEIEVDSDSSDGTDWLSIPSSSSIIGYIYENGRTYHQYHEGNYFMPNDERENDRLDLQYHMLNILFGGKLFLAPIKNPKRVLDLGTGTGIWAIDIADMFPDATIIANDLSPIQPTWVPPNCKFEIDDIELPWSHAMNSFDLIHTRYLFGSLEDWPRMIKQAYDHLTPGGYLEIQETDPASLKSDDGTLPPNSPLTQYCNILLQGSTLSGRPVSITDNLHRWLEDAGFEDITTRKYKLPISPWAKEPRLKEVGRLNAVNLVEGGGLEATILALYTRWIGGSLEECLEFVEGAKSVVRDRGVHAYWEASIVYARKPELEGRRSRSTSRQASIQLPEKLEGLVVATTEVSSSPSSSSSSTSSSDAAASPSIPSPSANIRRTRP
ncbi:S-adenosyl-L-methionine-dependent methyltransferase [Peziza echinospora]|nr:S-adenosyl-L-methionine-dependent methyltransferase [Peziza echinospora]